MKKLILGVALLVFTHHAEAQDEIIEAITNEARAQGVDPELAVAIATVESGLNPKAVGGLGELGLFQLRPEYHPQIIGKDMDVNIRTGIRYLRSVIKNCKLKYNDAAFICYNIGSNRARQIQRPRQFPYYIKVMQAKQKLAAQ